MYGQTRLTILSFQPRIELNDALPSCPEEMNDLMDPLNHYEIDTKAITIRVC